MKINSINDEILLRLYKTIDDRVFKMNFELSNSKACLKVAVVNFANVGDHTYVKSYVQRIFDEVDKFLPKGTYFLYLRDIKEYSIDGKYPDGHTYNKYESMVAVPSWEVDRKLVLSTIAHELHHLSRWRHAGYGTTLGEVILSEGLATLYETQVVDWSPPWSKTSLNNTIIKKAINEWNSEQYDHIEWFFDGKDGRWIGYTIGYRLARLIFSNNLDIEKSLNITVADFNAKTLLDKVR